MEENSIKVGEGVNPRILTSSEILFWGILSFLVGIVSASLQWNIIFILACVYAGSVGTLIFTKKNSIFLYSILCMFFTFLGAFYFNAYLNVKSYGEHITLDTKISFSGIISEDPHRFEEYQYFNLRLLPPNTGEIRIISSPAFEFAYGDKINATGIIRAKDSPVTLATAVFPDIEVASKHNGFWLKEKLLEIKSNLIARSIEFLPANEGALLSGITLGDRSRISKEFKAQMAASGTTHLVALSGYNIAIIALVVSQIFGTIFSRRKNFYLTNLLILVFVGMVGAEPSVVRAALMAFLILLAREIGGMYDIRNAIAVAAAAMAIANPVSVVYDIGFQLSFASLLGIVYVSPAITKLFRMDEHASTWKQNAVLTLSAQIAVIPIALHTFGAISLLGILANILILEFMPLTMFLGFVLVGVGELFRSGGFIIAKIIEPLLFYEVWVIRTFSSISIPLHINFSLATSVLYYAGLAIICAIINNKPTPNRQRQ